MKNDLKFNRTRKQDAFLILIMGALNTITPFSIDLYLPAFPEIATALHTGVASVALSVSTYFLGFSLGQIIYGPLLDRFGRKRPLYLGLILYILATLACGNVTSIHQLLILRFIQALGGSAASVAATAMVRDFFPAEKGVKVFSLMMLILSVSPLLAPTIGSFIATAWGWRAVFMVLTGMAASIVTLAFFYLPEGHEPDPSVQLKPSAIAHDFRLILKNPQFFTYAWAGSFSFAGLFVYVAGSPAIFMDGFHTSPKAYGAIFAFLAFGMIGGSQLNLALGKRYSNQEVFQGALMMQVVAGVIFLVGAWMQWFGLYSTLACLFVLLFCAGITYPNAAAIALAPFSRNAGRASALLGFLQLGLGSVLSAVVGLFAYPGSLPTAFVMASSASLGVLILVWKRKENWISSSGPV